MKRLSYFYSCIVAVLFTFLTITVSSASAQQTGFLTADKPAFLYLDTWTLNMNYDDEDIKFTLNGDGTLQLTSKNGREKYLTFSSFDSTNEGIGYAIRSIYTIFPSMEFIEINADRGAKAKNCGYWLIGKRNGTWVTYISWNNLASMGFTTNEWHQITTHLNEDATGRFILESSHMYMPPGAQYGYQMKSTVDLKLQLFWDQNAQWFGMRRI